MRRTKVGVVFMGIVHPLKIGNFFFYFELIQEILCAMYRVVMLNLAYSFHGLPKSFLQTIFAIKPHQRQQFDRCILFLFKIFLSKKMSHQPKQIRSQGIKWTFFFFLKRPV